VQFRLEYQPEAEETLANLQQTDPKKYKKVLKTLGLMQTNLRHPGLKTHKYDSLWVLKKRRYLKPMSRIKLSCL
jgi:mRNA-degrading endonuclease RelE of RelBE toxin-antitoxin system